MAWTTPRMALKVWNLATDPYDHEQLADNFLKLDQHDHTPGKGTQIPASGLAPNAVTGDKIAPESIGAGQIIDGSITSAEIQDGTIQLVDLSPQVLPPGVIWQYAGPTLPSGWLWCRGQDELISSYPALAALLGTTYGAAAAGSFKVPNFQQKFALGANTSGSYLLGATGGAISHTHNIPNHSHTGTFTGAASGLSGTVSGSTGNESGGHVHFGPGTGFIYVDAAGNNRISDLTGSGTRVSAGGYSSDTVDILGNPAHHTHSVSGTASGVGGSISTSGTVGSGTNPSGGTLNTGASSSDPPYVSVNYIIKI